MRHAVHEAFSKLSALDPEFIFSGWGATLTESELAVVENCLPREGNVMAQRNDGGPTFPTEPNTQPGFYAHHGMSLRDYFAGQALAGLAGRKFHKGDAGEGYAEWAASMAYEFADALLAARERT
jgi:hypothetical protein